VNAAFLFLSGIWLFLTLRSLQAGIISWCFSLAVTIAAVFEISLWSGGVFPYQVLGVHLFPSIGPYRYIWCYAFVALLVWE